MKTSALVFLAALILVPVASNAAVITVRNDGTGDYPLLRQAVLASMPGDSIEVGPGLYADNVEADIPHSLTIYSTHGAVATILDGQYSDRVIRVSGPGVAVDMSGLTIRRGTTAGNVGGGLAATMDAVVTIRDCVFEENEKGALALARGTQAIVERCVFVNNYTGSSASGTGGIYISSWPDSVPGTSTVVDVTDCEFRDNYAGKAGGGINVVGGSLVTVSRCEFFDNTGPTYAGAIHCGEGSSVDIDGCLFARNSAIAGSAVYYYLSTGDVTGNTFYQNATSVEPYGSVLMHYTGASRVERNIFTQEFAGHGLHVIGATPVRSCNLYWQNGFGSVGYQDFIGAPVVALPLTADEQEASPLFCAAALDDYSVADTSPAAPAFSPCGQLIGAFPVGCTIRPPGLLTVRSDGTGDYDLLSAAVAASVPGDSIEVGPGVYPDSAVAEIGHSLTVYSTHGAAATVLDGQYQNRLVRVVGSGMTVDVSGLTIRNGTVAGNVGGGFAATMGPVLFVRDCVFEDNEKGALSIARGTQATVERCAFVGNVTGSSASGTGGVYVSGWLESPTVATFVDCEFRNNYAGRAGGGINVVNGASVTATRCEFYDNAGPTYGGAISCGEGSAVDIEGCLFVRNSAVAGSAAYFYRSAGDVVGNTFYDNTTVDEFYGALLLQRTTGVAVERNIFAGENHGHGISIVADPVSRSCNLYWDNKEGAVGFQNFVGDVTVPLPLESDEQQADPMFCDVSMDGFTLYGASPAAPANSLCGQLVGAFGVECGPVATTIASFAARAADGGVELEWEVASDGAIEGYAVWRGEVPVADLPADARSYTDDTVEPGRAYTYILVVTAEGADVRSQPVRVTAKALKTALGQNHPNPFNPTTRIPYSLSERGDVRVAIYDVAGRLVRTLVDRNEPAGSRSVYWDGHDNRGERVASGVYFYRMRAGKFTETRKMILVR